MLCIEWAWMYANQAVMLDIHFFLYCSTSLDSNASNSTIVNYGQDESNSEFKDLSRMAPIIDLPYSVQFFQWSHKFWLQGPRHTKLLNATIDIPRFTQLLTSAKTLFLETAERFKQQIYSNSSNG